MRRAAPAVAFMAILAGCGFLPAVATPPPSATPMPTATPSPLPSDTPGASAAATPAPTALEDAIPRFAVGSLVATNAPGLRVRSRPGTEQRVATTLGTDARLLVGLGPIIVDELGWYLVRDADDADPAFAEGWVAAGFEPDPFLVSAGFAPDESPFLAGYAGTEPGEFGPVPMPHRGVTLRWIATTYRREVCNFSLDLAGESGEPVRAVRTPVGAFPASGELPAAFIRTNDRLRDQLFALVQSDCSWAIAFARVPAATPSPSPS